MWRIPSKFKEIKFRKTAEIVTGYNSTSSAEIHDWFITHRLSACFQATVAWFQPGTSALTNQGGASLDRENLSCKIEVTYVIKTTSTMLAQVLQCYNCRRDNSKYTLYWNRKETSGIQRLRLWERFVLHSSAQKIKIRPPSNTKHPSIPCVDTWAGLYMLGKSVKWE